MGRRPLVLAVVLGLTTVSLAAAARPERAPRRFGILGTIRCSNIPLEVSRGGRGNPE